MITMVTPTLMTMMMMIMIMIMTITTLQWRQRRWHVDNNYGTTTYAVDCDCEDDNGFCGNCNRNYEDGDVGNGMSTTSVSVMIRRWRQRCWLWWWWWWRRWRCRSDDDASIAERPCAMSTVTSKTLTVSATIEPLKLWLQLQRPWWRQRSADSDSTCDVTTVISCTCDKTTMILLTTTTTSCDDCTSTDLLRIGLINLMLSWRVRLCFNWLINNKVGVWNF